MQVLQYLWHSGSAVVVRGLESTGSIVVVRGISCFEALTRPGIRPMSAVLAGGFLLCPREDPFVDFLMTAILTGVR